MPVKKRPPNRAKRSSPALLPAPVGGLNGRDSYVDMPPSDAFLMDNWFPHNTSVDIRGGTLDFAWGMEPVESLEVYTGAAGSRMLAFGGGNIYDVTATGEVLTAPLETGRNSNRITSAMFSNAGEQWLLLYSGEDQPLAYNGVMMPLTITGMTGTHNTFYNPHVYKGRVFLAQVDQLGFYYLDPGAIQGPAHYFDLAEVSLKGGGIQCITSISQTGAGTGPQDYILFVTTEGEYILYGGIDPSDPDNWVLLGRYVGSVPIGRKGYFHFRSDVYFITMDGVLSGTQIQQTGEASITDEYITAKLGVNYKNLATYNFVHGWCGLLYPKAGMLLVNMPMTGAISGEYVQFAMNTDTDAWGKFKGLPAICWALFNRIPYYGTYDGRVVQFDRTPTDNGMEIRAVARQAWNTFDNDKGIGAMDKQFHMASIVLKGDGIPNVSCNINVNFEDDQPPQVGQITPQPGAVWDFATWNVDYWAGAASAHNVFISIGKIGYVGSLWLEASSLVSTVEWVASRILIEPTKQFFL